LDALLLIGLCRYLSVVQVSRDLFDSMPRCRRRLRALYDLGYLNVALAGGASAANLYCLTRKGLALLLQRRADAAASIRLPGLLRLAGAPHHLAIADCRLYAAAWGALRRVPLLRWSNAGGQLGIELNLVGLEPDGLAEFETPDGPIVIAVECDRGTEAVSTVLRRKLEKYLPVSVTGKVDALWLVITGGPKRHASILGVVTELGLYDWTRIIPHDHVTQRPVRDLPPRTLPSPNTARTARTNPR
jgi:hypothetical protein